MSEGIRHMVSIERTRGMDFVCDLIDKSDFRSCCVEFTFYILIVVNVKVMIL
jgi:hypothetical protein